jgi:hypothetical protein
LGSGFRTLRDLHPIFNGKDLAGWQVPAPNPFWRVVDGTLVGENDEKLKGDVLYTEKKYKDFIIETEARWSGEIDSGIMLRKPELQLQFGISRSPQKGHDVLLLHRRAGALPRSGRAKDISKLLKGGRLEQDPVASQR